MLEALAKRTAGLSAVLLVLSVAYDFSFLHAAGLSFQTIPTSIADHVRSAILWAPGVVAGGLIGLVAGLGTPPNQPPNSKPPRSRRLVDLVFFLSVLPSTLLFAIFSPLAQALPMVGMLVGMLLLRFQPGARNVEERLGPGTAPTVFGVPALVGLVASIGAMHGWAFVSATKPTIQVVIKSGGAERTVQVTALRRFSSTTILAESGSLTVLPSDAVLAATHQKPKESHILCTYLAVQCPKP